MHLRVAQHRRVPGRLGRIGLRLCQIQVWVRLLRGPVKRPQLREMVRRRGFRNRPQGNPKSCQRGRKCLLRLILHPRTSQQCRHQQEHPGPNRHEHWRFASCKQYIIWFWHMWRERSFVRSRVRRLHCTNTVPYLCIHHSTNTEMVVIITMMMIMMR